jgi:hypothetical protein
MMTGLLPLFLLFIFYMTLSTAPWSYLIKIIGRSPALCIKNGLKGIAPSLHQTSFSASKQ